MDTNGCDPRRDTNFRHAKLERERLVSTAHSDAADLKGP
jgi:hypothetical protein